MFGFKNNNTPKQYQIIKDFQLTFGKDRVIEIRPSGTIIEFDYMIDKYIDKDGCQYEVELVENNPLFFLCINNVPTHKIISLDVWSLDDKSITITFNREVDVDKIGTDVLNAVQTVLDKVYNDTNIK